MFKNNVQKVWKSTIAYLVGSIAFIQLDPNISSGGKVAKNTGAN